MFTVIVHYNVRVTLFALTFLLGLRHFRLEIEHENCWCRSCKNKDKIISALTVQLVLRRMPQLSFEISRNVCDCEDFPCSKWKCPKAYTERSSTCSCL